ncbi:hypothetical protein E2134_13090 [Escherichia coli]|nr:hypothetical protein E2134_13090 [Escherichia coli]
MDKKLLALLILASLSPAEAALTKIPAGFEVIAQGQQEYIEVYFQGKISVNIMQWLILIP